MTAFESDFLNNKFHDKYEMPVLIIHNLIQSHQKIQYQYADSHKLSKSFEAKKSQFPFLGYLRIIHKC